MSGDAYAERPRRSPNSRRAMLRKQVRLLTALLDTCYPGSAERGKKVAALARQMSSRFEMPRRFAWELDAIARIYDLGRVVSRIAEGVEVPGQRWHHAVNLRAVLRRAGGLEEAADVAGSIYENWDGTGLPSHLAQGQIPLRSRILRVVIDFVEKVESTGQNCEEILSAMAEHSGTHYDPMAIVHLLQISLADVSSLPNQSNVQRLPIRSLEVGMVLAQDLHTDAGLKLLARGTVLTRATLEAVLRRHRFDPIVGGVLVRRRSS